MNRQMRTLSLIAATVVAALAAPSSASAWSFGSLFGSTSTSTTSTTTWPPPPGPDSTATVTRTEQNVANIEATDMKGGGYGIGYAMAEDNICTLAENYLTLRGERSLHFGPSGVNSDLYNSYINSTGKIQKLLSTPPPSGPSQEAIDLLDGYVAGYNAYLADVGVANIPDPRCRGKAWVRPIERMDVARRIYEVSGLGGRDLVRDGMVAASPPGLLSLPSLPTSLPLVGPVPVVSDVAKLIEQYNSGIGSIDAAKISQLATAFANRVNTRGSNAIGLGADATANSNGMLLANPHWNWDGADKFWQMHVNVPGKMHSSGMSFLGVPLVMIGHNEHLAWSHTVSAARRFAVVQTPLVPWAPTKYIVDGIVRDMKKTPITVQVRESNGSITTRSKTFYSTIYGPVTTSVMGIDLLPWTQLSAHSVVDMNESNSRMINQFIESNRASTVDEFHQIHAKYSANPWATTTVADDRGDTLWTDVGTIPNISNLHASTCNTAIGQVLWNTFGVAILRGGTSACKIPNDPAAAASQVMPASKQPVIKRRDYVENSNESYWLTNAKQPLTGYSRVFGPQKSTRATRTRMGHKLVLDRLNGTDGAPGTRFTRQLLQDTAFNNRNNFGEMWAADLAKLCRSAPKMLSLSAELVDVSEACPVLEQWDRSNNLDSAGAVLFTRFAERAMASIDFATSYAGLPNLPMWRVPFDVNDPVNTPRGLNPAWPLASTGLASAVADLRKAGIPLDATLRQRQISSYGGVDIPIHGGEGVLGLFNAMNSHWNGNGYSAGGGGASFVMVTSFGAGCPDDRSLLLGSQRSGLSGWPHAHEQVQRYADKNWVDPPFCASELAAAPKLSVTQLGPGGVQ
jgi:acyl-homoserine-lactone acylase